MRVRLFEGDDVIELGALEKNPENAAKMAVKVYHAMGGYSMGDKVASKSGGFRGVGTVADVKVSCVVELDGTLISTPARDLVEVENLNVTLFCLKGDDKFREDWTYKVACGRFVNGLLPGTFCTLDEIHSKTEARFKIIRGGDVEWL